MVAAVVASEAVTAPVMTGWRIQFAPQPSLFRSGNDPMRILRELALNTPDDQPYPLP